MSYQFFPSIYKFTFMHCKKTFHLESFDFFKKCSQIYKSLIKLLSFVSELEKP
jgi:hypothetical protein